ncbi:MAG: hypothetical protein ACREQI_08315 [Candidatus Binataceae bacterium]
MNPQRLELTWIGKENRPKLEPRILLEDAEKSYHAQHRITGRDLSVLAGSGASPSCIGVKPEFRDASRGGHARA